MSMELMEIKESTLTVAELQNKKLASSCNKISKAVMNIKKNALVVAEQLHVIKKEELFTEDFKSFSEFADTIGIGKSRASKLVKVWERLVESNGTLETFNATQIEEMLPLDVVTNIDTVEENVITPDMKASEIRKKVKELTKEETEEQGTETTEEQGTETTEEQETEKTEEFTSLKIGKNGYNVKATEDEILKLIKKHFELV